MKNHLFGSPFLGNKILMFYIDGLLICLLNLSNWLYFKQFWV